MYECQNVRALHLLLIYSSTPTFAGWTEDLVTSLTESQLLVRVRGAPGHQLSLLPVHHLQQLVDQEGWRNAGDSCGGDGHHLSTYRTVDFLLLCDLLQALEADCVGAGQQLGAPLCPVIFTLKCHQIVTFVKSQAKTCH